MKYFFTASLFFFTYFFSFGQEFNEVLKQDIFGNPSDAQNQMYINMMNRSNDLKQVAETSLYEDWQATEAIDKNGITFTIDSANYNYSTDQFYFTHHNKLYYLNSGKAKSVKIGSDHFSPFVFQEKKEKKNGFFQVLVDGDFPLIKRIYLKKTIVNDHPMKIAQADRVVIKKETDLFYLDQKADTARPLPVNKKKFINLFKKRQAKLLRFAQEEKISTKDENDLIRFFEYNKMINKD
ncbi:MAG: hypothetical protein AAFZ15_07070 [Bacteroidota bacterium]